MPDGRRVVFRVAGRRDRPLTKATETRRLPADPGLNRASKSMDFFIVGTSRSGSTLLRNMLSRHPRVGVVNESHWLPRMYEFFGTGSARVEEILQIIDKTHWDSGKRVIDVNLELAGMAWDELLTRLRRRLGSWTTATALHDAVVDELFRGGSPDLIRGDKTPDYGYHMNLLQELWPQARFVHVVRSGLNTALSMSKHKGCQLMISGGYDNWCSLSYDHLYKRYKRRKLPLAEFVASWRRRINRIRNEAASLQADSYLELRYEDLINQPEVALTTVANFLAIDDETQWLTRAARIPQHQPRPLHDEQVFKHLTALDMRALTEVGDIDYLRYAPDADADEIWAGVLEGKQALVQLDYASAARIGLSLLATRLAEQDSDVRNEALTLVQNGLAGAGDNHEARRWADMAVGDPYPCEL